MTQSLEDYLETIYLLMINKKVARVKDISERLSVSGASVVQALKELKERELLVQEPYGYIELTEKGLAQAKRVFKKHLILKDFLMKILGVSEKTAEEDACKIEHCLSDETFLKMKEFISKKS